MGKSKGQKPRGSKEYDTEQRLKEENRQLKRQIAKLRNVVSNIDTSHYKFVQDLLESEGFKQEEREADNKAQKKMEEQWRCFTCGRGVLRLVILGRAGVPYYMRKCDCCDNKTKLKPYTEDVTGVS